MNRRVADFVFSNVKTREFTCVNDRSLNHAEKAEDAPLYSFWRCALILVLGAKLIKKWCRERTFECPCKGVYTDVQNNVNKRWLRIQNEEKGVISALSSARTREFTKT